MTRIEEILRKNPLLSVLFLSTPEGDTFTFGTHEELENEQEAHEEEGTQTELATAREFLDKLDFEVYEGNEPTIWF